MARKKERMVDVVVTLDAASLDHLDDVADRLRKQGLEVTQSLDALGQVLGRIAPDRVDRLRPVHGVLDVEVTGEVSIPSPDEDVQ